MPVVAEKNRPEKELRWSVRRKTVAVVRLLRGEDIDTLAEAHLLLESTRLLVETAMARDGLAFRGGTATCQLRYSYCYADVPRRGRRGRR